MDFEVLSELVERGLSIRQISRETGKGYSTIRYHVSKYGMRTSPNNVKNSEGLCTICGEKGEFWNNGERKHTHCKKCFSKSRKSRRLARKLKAIEYLGGECKSCGGKFHPDIYEFHHRDPSQKDAPLSKLLRGSWEKSVVELDKCDLLCANCHRLEHAQDYGFGIDLKFESPGTKTWIDPRKVCHCGNKKSVKAKTCVKCLRKSREKVDWPSDEDLMVMIEESSISAVGRSLGVSNVAVGRRIRRIKSKKVNG